jgi:hypothetical protein
MRKFHEVVVGIEMDGFHEEQVDNWEREGKTYTDTSCKTSLPGGVLLLIKV